jgi:hypothetical protein
MATFAMAVRVSFQLPHDVKLPPWPPGSQYE